MLHLLSLHLDPEVVVRHCTLCRSLCCSYGWLLQLDPSVALHVSHHDVELAVRIPGFKRVGGLLLSELATLQIPLVQAELADAKVTSTPPPRRHITAVNIVLVLPVGVVCAPRAMRCMSDCS